MTAMIGAASTTDHAMLRTGLRHSPAWIATYSKPPNAPNPILPRRLRLMIDTTGIAVASGWNAASVPERTFSHGRRSSAANVAIISAPPALCTHLPTPSPSTVTTTRPPTITVLTSPMNHRLPASHSMSGPMM